MKRLLIKDKEQVKEKIQLYFSGNDEAKFILRLHAILLFLEKNDASCDNIGLLSGPSPRTISNWVNRINETDDIESLRSKKQTGRPSRLLKAQRQELSMVIQESPDRYGISSKKWSGKCLSAYIERRYGVVMKTRTCQRFLRQLEFKFKRVHPEMAQDAKEKKIKT